MIRKLLIVLGVMTAYALFAVWNTRRLVRKWTEKEKNDAPR